LNIDQKLKFAKINHKKKDYNNNIVSNSGIYRRKMYENVDLFHLFHLKKRRWNKQVEQFLPLFYKAYKGSKKTVPPVPPKKYITLETTFFFAF
jgi:hypothetical protein